MKESFNKLLSKQENRIFLSFVVCAIALIIYGTIMIYIMDIIHVDLENETDGYIAVAKTFAAIFSMFGTAIFAIFFSLFPKMLAFNSVISAGIARIFKLGEEKKWKNILSVIFNILGLLPLVFMIFILFSILEVTLMLNIFACVITLIVLVILVAFVIYIIKEMFNDDKPKLVDNQE